MARSPSRRGSLNIDDEGTPTQCTTLIEDGVLRGLHAGPTQRAAHGRQVHRQRPPRIVRARHDAAHDQHLHAARSATIRGEILASVQRGIYAVNFGGGQVDITSGKFVFSASEAYLIENGRVGAADQGRHAGRQRPGCAHARGHGRQRSEARRRHRRVRQGRPERAGRRRSADAAHRWTDGGRDRLTPQASSGGRLQLPKPVYESLPWLYALAGALLAGGEPSTAFGIAFGAAAHRRNARPGGRGGHLVAAARLSGHARRVLVARRTDRRRWR